MNETIKQPSPASESDVAKRSKKKPVPVHSGQSVSDALVTILRHDFECLPQWELAARSWEDVEGVHQMRVSFRRMRSALTTFRSAVPKKTRRAWSEEMCWLGGQLGDARDLDVFIDEALGAVAGRLQLAGEKELRQLAEAHRAAAYGKARAMLDGERYAAFKHGFEAWLSERSWLRESEGSKKRKRLHGNIVPYSRSVLDKLERRVLSRGSRIDIDSRSQMHRLRIHCKKLRYAAEFFSPIFAGMSSFIGHMRGLQDLLGAMHDVMVTPSLLEDLLTDSPDRKAAEYAGGIVGWRTHEYYNLLETFDHRWKEFVKAKRPWRKKSAVIHFENAD